MVQYTYGDSNWKDKLTAYNGNAITYDEIGNPLSYYNGTTFEWDNGRQLVRATKQDGTYMSYRYDDSGVRIRKSVNGAVTDYFVDGTKIIAEKTGDNIIWYYYDAAGTRIGFTYNDTAYYYVYNAQGDVIGLYDGAQNIVARYNYDAWGKIISVTNANGAEITNTTHIAHINPFRYRGYYYDFDTGLYYVSSRYYDPEIGRWINADTTDILTATPMGLTDKNLFSYCDNNPVMRADHGGRFWDTIFDLFSLGVSFVEVCINPTDSWAWAGLAGDAVDLIPFVTGVGEATRGAKTTVKVVDKATDIVDTAKTIYKTSDAASDIRRATGSYEILYKSGKNYIGKGGFNRAITSATRNAKKYGDKVTSIKWKKAPNSRVAFIDEYLMQKNFGGVLSFNRNLPTYNKIWSPGRRYFGD